MTIPKQRTGDVSSDLFQGRVTRELAGLSTKLGAVRMPRIVAEDLAVPPGPAFVDIKVPADATVWWPANVADGEVVAQVEWVGDRLRLSATGGGTTVAIVVL